jgi:GntR family phosphonate transport system transcriptional regulator
MTSPVLPLWSQIARILRQELSALPPGARLPTESQLATRFGVNRHTVRHALASLTDEGLILTRRGAGTFTTMRPVDYPLTRRPRFHAALNATGRAPGRRILSMQTLAADPETAAALDLPAGAPILRLEGLSLSEGVVIGHFRSSFPLDRLPDLPAALSQTASITDALAACGITDYARDWTRISARRADGLLAGHLKLAEGEALLRSESLNRDDRGQPVEHAITHFAGGRITLTIKPD